jgi:hypothetical protein
MKFVEVCFCDDEKSDQHLYVSRSLSLYKIVII